MMKNKGASYIFYVSVFVIFALLLFLTCRYTLGAYESRSLFIGAVSVFVDYVAEAGGFTKWLTAFIVQFFATPIVAVGITALLLTFISIFIGRFIKPLWAKPLAMLPSLTLVLVLYDGACSYSVVVSYLLMGCALWMMEIWHKFYLRLASYALLTVILMLIAGPVSMLFGVLALLVACKDYGIKGLMFTVAPVMAWILGLIFVYDGVFADMSRAITPAGYCSGWHAAPSYTWLPWISVAAVFVAAVFLKPLQLKSGNSRAIGASVCAAIVLVVGFVGVKQLMNPEWENFSRLSQYVAQEDWQSVIDDCKTLQMNDSKYQNCLNLALAETGQLPKTMFQHPVSGPQSLIDGSQKSPEMFMLLSDIFYAMGHISMAQKYAFEANEGVGDMSPRMLKRLIDLNLITGQYAVAEKYINLLSATSRYHGWAEGRRLMLYDDGAVNAHPVLGLKRGCLATDNEFAGIKGVEHDLKNIVRANPAHHTTIDYLGCLLLASKNVPAFIEVIDEFYGTEALGHQLPKHFQEAVAVAAIATDSRLDLKYQLHPSVMENCRDFWSRHRTHPNTFWQYLKSSPNVESVAN